MTQGYVYRIANADGETLLRVIRAVIALPCWTFGGASVWDFDAAKRDNLRPISKIMSATAVTKDHIKGDFGHAFARNAEVRWKRRDAQTYDVLILTEEQSPQWMRSNEDQSLAILDQEQQSITHAQPLTVAWRDARGRLITGAWSTSDGGNAGIVQSDNRPSIKYVTYHALNGATQFVRYMEVQS